MNYKLDLEKINCYNQDAHIRMSIQDYLKGSLNAFEEFLAFIKKNRSDSFNDFIINLEKQYGNIDKYDVNLDLPNSLKMLHANPELMDNSINALLSLINYPKYQLAPINKKQRINIFDSLSSFPSFVLYWITSLKNILSKDETLELYRTFIDEITQKGKNISMTISDLDAYIEVTKSFFKRTKTHKGLIGKCSKGKIIIKITKCMFADLMERVNDAEFGYLVYCHQDFIAAKNFNPNFILTRKKTLMQGANYCDFCYHDSRYDKKIEHPPEEFWENL